MKLYLNEIKLPVSACKKPKMTNVKGASWDCAYIKINDVKIPVWSDTSWGQCMYFQLNDKWYRLRMFNDKPNYGIDLYDSKPINLITQ